MKHEASHEHPRAHRRADSAEGEAGAHAQHPPVAPAGLKSEEQGYVLELTETTGHELAFVIHTPDGGALRHFARVHDGELHLIVVSRDLHHYAHLHPRRDAAGTWSVSLPALEPGGYWIYADFTVPGGPALTLRHDLSMAGAVVQRAAPVRSNAAHVDGFHVEFDGTLRAQSAQTLTFRVQRDGVAVELEPYLGARGHLVIIRAVDGAFLHVHPVEGAAASGEVAFKVHAPSAGRHELFLDFQIGGQVHTAAFSADVDESAPTRS